MKQIIYMGTTLAWYDQQRGTHSFSYSSPFILSEKMGEVRAGDNGTAGTAMAVPVFEGEKWRRLDSNLACVIECPL